MQPTSRACNRKERCNERVTIRLIVQEVAPRDGLQIEPVVGADR
jgi:hypothetical protein